MNKIVPCICIPSSGQVKAKFAVSLASLMCCVGSTKLREGVEEQRINVYLLSMAIGTPAKRRWIVGMERATNG